MVTYWCNLQGLCKEGSDFVVFECVINNFDESEQPKHESNYEAYHNNWVEPEKNKFIFNI